MSEHLLEVKDLAVSFSSYAGKIRAVRGVSFHLDAGETLAIVGESGCGKTVTVKALMKLYGNSAAFIEEGSSILFKGQEVVTMNNKELSKLRGEGIGMIFQDPMTSLNPTLTVGYQIAEGIRFHDKSVTKAEAEKRAAELLALVGIPSPEERIKQYPHQLSGGMRQRVMIAIAIACNADIIICDEPTTALDVTIQAQVLELLNELKEKTNKAFILVTHDLGIVFDFADRIQVMYAGVILERGTKYELFDDPHHPYTWALLNSVPSKQSQRKGSLYSIQGTPPDLMMDIKGCPFADRCDYCMPICKERMPQEIAITESHGVSCWLEHSMAPKVKAPAAGGEE
ncbi:MAG: ABC transporter ATP-binding protein [Firmicutes bacterium]|nr:ABC transporter ATP-binding protein [Bacillota bacterium]MBQ1888295.1 ABC transporter ATP-binding protein [Bacillota bacterium]MBQ2455561.1 ABC transporter ATP-binding protein [Bacillota bacterium]MBQ3578755.1 ABC transporter ATP-binding protein [Bacillota bacterium]MBQ4235030.1 ABC transporter ATP-binding protein [Bacillota bacterium]